MTLLHRALRVALPVVACSCSSPSAPSSEPVIDSLTLPPSFTVSGNQYSVQGTITFHDAKGSVTGLREKIPAYNLDHTISVAGAGSQGTAQILLGLDAPSPIASGTSVEIDVSVVDDNGVESNVEVEHVSVP